jgi:hypothetical protein
LIGLREKKGIFQLKSTLVWLDNRKLFNTVYMPSLTNLLHIDDRPEILAVGHGILSWLDNGTWRRQAAYKQVKFSVPFSCSSPQHRRF